MRSHASSLARVLVPIVFFLLVPSAPAQNSTSSPSHAAPQVGARVITVWKVGNPWRGDTPATAFPPSLADSAHSMGYDLKVEDFPHLGFASVFFRAFEHHQAPDILVFNNYGILRGISTPIGRFTGIGTAPEIHAALVQVTESLTALEGHGWEYLIRTSPNFEAARALALRPLECPAILEGELPTEIADVAMPSVRAYLEGSASLQDFEDPDRLHTDVTSKKEHLVEAIKACGYWGTDHLAFVPTRASYTSPEAIGWVSTLMVLRKQDGPWRVLAASTDPVSNQSFVSEIPGLVRLITKPWVPPSDSEPSSLVEPPDGKYPVAAPGERFGDFSWHPSPSSGEVAEVAEFAYNGDARLFAIFFSGPAPDTEHLSAGMLWTWNGMWRWRVWSISESGDVMFSPPRTFTE